MNALRKAAYGCVGLWLLLLPATVVADDTSEIYESVADSAIGPVFLTQAQRAWLDKRRLLPPAPAVASESSVATGERPAPARKPAGYIVSASGKRSDWSNGDFVMSASSSAASKAFPGDVNLIRHEAAAAEAESGDDDNETSE